MKQNKKISLYEAILGGMGPFITEDLEIAVQQINDLKSQQPTYPSNPFESDNEKIVREYHATQAQGNPMLSTYLNRVDPMEKTVGPRDTTGEPATAQKFNPNDIIKQLEAAYSNSISAMPLMMGISEFTSNLARGRDNRSTFNQPNDTYYTHAQQYGTNLNGTGMMEKGGEINPIEPPTTSDSLALLKNSQMVEQYYKDRDYDKTAENTLKYLGFHSLDFARDQFEGSSGFIGPDGQESADLHKYYKKIDENRFKQREMINGILDTRSPFPLFDRRIAPTKEVDYYLRDTNDPLFGDKVSIAQYDPLAVTPISMLTPEQRKERESIYGKEPTSTVAKKDDPTTVTKKPYVPNMDTDLSAYLQSKGESFKFSDRKALAKEYGIEGYKGTAEQNLELLGMVKKGKPTSATPTSTKALEGKSEKIKGMRKVGRKNADGTESTVLMASAEVDGRQVAYPTLFPRDPDNYNTSKKSWIELNPREAYAEALKRDEVFYFDTEQKAQAFAEGSWKEEPSDSGIKRELKRSIKPKAKPQPKPSPLDQYKDSDYVTVQTGKPGSTLSEERKVKVSDLKKWKGDYRIVDHKKSLANKANGGEVELTQQEVDELRAQGYTVEILG